MHYAKLLDEKLLDSRSVHPQAGGLVVGRGRADHRTAAHHHPHLDRARCGPAGLGGLDRHWHRGAGFFHEQGRQGEPAGLPNRVEDAMADIAVVFHWPPQAMDGMELTELMAWRERARERCEAE